jgi:hypothetical protein
VRQPTGPHALFVRDVQYPFNQKAGDDQAKDWIAKNAADTGVAAPKVSEGPVIVHVK